MWLELGSGDRLRLAWRACARPSGFRPNSVLKSAFSHPKGMLWTGTILVTLVSVHLALNITLGIQQILIKYLWNKMYIKPVGGDSCL